MQNLDILSKAKYWTKGTSHIRALVSQVLPGKLWNNVLSLHTIPQSNKGMRYTKLYLFKFHWKITVCNSKRIKKNTTCLVFILNHVIRKKCEKYSNECIQTAQRVLERQKQSLPGVVRKAGLEMAFKLDHEELVWVWEQRREVNFMLSE